jgi:hypothetical protein
MAAARRETGFIAGADFLRLSLRPGSSKADIRMPRGMRMSAFDASFGSETARFMFFNRFVFA